jgi:hypothetical protein
MRDSLIRSRRDGERHSTEFKQQPLCNPGVVVNHVRLRKAIAQVQYFVEIREREATSLDILMLSRRHVSIFATNAR